MNQVYAVDSCALADVTNDKKINLADYSTLTSDFLNDSVSQKSDINQDGTVNLADYSLLTTASLAGCSFTEPCAKVMHNGLIQKQFCQDTTNPIQEALDFAHTHNMSDVLLEPGTFVLRNRVNVPLPQPIPAGLHVPSNIRLSGSSDPQQPTQITVDPASPYMDIMLYAGDDLSDPTKTLVNTTLEFLILNADKTDGNKVPLAIWTGKTAGNVIIQNNTVKNTGKSGMSLGFFAQFQDSGDGIHGTLYPFAGLPDKPNVVRNNTVSQVGGDAIGITGEYTLVQNNTIEKAAVPGVSSGVALFINSNHNTVENNTISDCEAGVGLDGSYPKLITDPTDIQVQLDQAGIGNEEGFTHENAILNNTITNCQKGVSLWRSKYVNVDSNTMNFSDTNTVGVSLVESRENSIVHNTITNPTVGILFRSSGYSQQGASVNSIGQGNNPEQGNTITSVSAGTYFEGDAAKLQGNRIFLNTFINQGCNFTGSAQTIAVGNTPDSCNLN